MLDFIIGLVVGVYIGAFIMHVRNLYLAEREVQKEVAI